MEAAAFFEKLLTTYTATLCHQPEDPDLSGEAAYVFIEKNTFKELILVCDVFIVYVTPRPFIIHLNSVLL
jgi:hypothetical protein